MAALTDPVSRVLESVPFNVRFFFQEGQSSQQTGVPLQQQLRRLV